MAIKLVMTGNHVNNVGTVVHLGNGVDAEISIDQTVMTNVNKVLHAEGIPAVTPEIANLIVATFLANSARGREEALKAAGELRPVKDFFVSHGYPLASIALAVAQIVQAAAP